MFWKVFIDKKTGRELFAYSLDGEGGGEEQETKALLAYEKGIPEDQILTIIERRPEPAEPSRGEMTAPKEKTSTDPGSIDEGGNVTNVTP